MSLESEQSIDNRQIEVDRKIEALEIENEALDREIYALYSEQNVTCEQVTQYLSKKENFSNENWQSLLQQRKILEERIAKELNCIVNPIKQKKKFQERNVSQHWLFVR